LKNGQAGALQQKELCQRTVDFAIRDALAFYSSLDYYEIIVQRSGFQPVRRHALVRMRNSCGADDKHGAEDCGRENPVLLF